MDIVSIAQIAAAVGTLILAVLTFAYVLFTRSMVKELRETRIAQDRPQVIVDADYTDISVINVVVRNIGPGAAKDITFEFVPPLMRSPKDGSDLHSMDELPYFKEGIDYLAPGAEISSFWDSYISLFPHLEEHGPKEGFTVTSKYKSLTGEEYETPWKINPLILKSREFVRRGTMADLVRHVEKLSKNFDRAIWAGELRVATKTERKKEAAELRAQLEAKQDESEQNQGQ